jgi:hypothetical protein
LEPLEVSYDVPYLEMIMTCLSWWRAA